MGYDDLMIDFFFLSEINIIGRYGGIQAAGEAAGQTDTGETVAGCADNKVRGCHKTGNYRYLGQISWAYFPRTNSDLSKN